MLGFIDRFLTLWIFLAIFLGLILGIIFPNIALFWNLFEYKSVNVVLTLCLILMMYPPLAKVDYAKLSKVFDSKKVILLSMILNWFIGPFAYVYLSFYFLKRRAFIYARSYHHRLGKMYRNGGGMERFSKRR